MPVYVEWLSHTAAPPPCLELQDAVPMHGVPVPHVVTFFALPLPYPALCFQQKPLSINTAGLGEGQSGLN